MRDFIRELCAEISYNYVVRRVTGYELIKNNVQLPGRKQSFYLFVNSWYKQLVEIPDDARAFHLIRDPRDALVSQYFSWRNSHKVAFPWIVEARPFLRSHNFEEGMFHLIEKDAFLFGSQMEGWTLGNRPTVLEVKYEELLADEVMTFAKIVSHLGLELPENDLLRIVRECSFEKKSGGRRRGDEEQSSHLRKGVEGDWKNHMPEGSPLHEAFMEQYGHLLNQLNYA